MDEAVSEYVQMIFSMYKDGLSIGRIAKRLNQMGVLSPMEYKHSAGVKFDTVFKTGDTAKWTYKAVQRILQPTDVIVWRSGRQGARHSNYNVRVVESRMNPNGSRLKMRMKLLSPTRTSWQSRS